MQVMAHGSFTVDILMLMVGILMLVKKTFISISMRRAVKILQPTERIPQPSGREHYESIMFAAAALNNMINIVPKYNMISNIGIDIESTHSVADIRLVPRRNQKLMYKKVYEISFPLKHPNDIKRNVNYDRKYKVSRFGRYCDLIEIGIRRVLWGRKK